MLCLSVCLCSLSCLEGGGLVVRVTAPLRPGGTGLTAGRAQLPLTRTALSVNFSHSGRCGLGGNSSRGWGQSIFTGEGVGGFLCRVCWGGGGN